MIQMLASIVFILFVGFTSADYGWKSGTQYSYSVRGRTVTGLNQLANQFTGVLMRAVLNIQVKSDSTLSLEIKEPEYAEVHANLSSGWDTEIPDEFLHYNKLPLLNEPFELYLDDGIIKEMIVDKHVPTWQVNILKSIVSLLQIDLQGQNIKQSTMNLLPSNMSSGVFTTMEDSINGVYETIYDVSELREYVLQSRPELLPLPHLKGNGKILEIVKSRNFSNGDQHMVHHYGLDGQTNWEPGSNHMGNFLTRTSVSHIIISGNLKHYTIQSSVTNDKIIIAPHLYNKQKGIVASRLNLTIESVKSIEQPIPVVSNPCPIRNLVYEYNPFGKKRETSQENTEENLSDNGTELRSSKKETYHKFSDSFSSLSSSNESEYENTRKPYLLSNFKLSESPYNDFLSLYINEKSELFHGQTINTSQNVMKLAREISQGIIAPNTISAERTLHKFTTLIHILRTMSAQELKEISDRLYYPYAKAKRGNIVNNALNYQTWVSLRDAIGQAGSGPALITIRDWIISQKIKGEEAAQLIASLSYSAKWPTIEYLEYFFEMLDEKMVQKQSTLRTSAVLSFADLVHKAVVDRRFVHNYYPVHIFGILTKKSEKIVSKKFIPYFQKQLHKAVGENNPVNIQLNIHALNSIAHPRVLFVLKPYLEGKIPISKFQRLTIITSMNKITKLYPDLAQTILFRIYQNMADIPEIRIAAVMQLMKTNPSAQMLQQMAEQTNIDRTKQVNAAVKSAIESVASQEKNEFNWKMVEKARAAVNLLTPENYGVQYSRNFIKSYIVKGQNLAYKHHLAYIQSHDSIFPSSIFYNLKNNIGGYKYNINEMQFMTSSMNKLFRWFAEFLGLRKIHLREDKKSRSNSTWSLANIYNIINLKEEEEEQLEGNFLATIFGVKRFNAFDNYTIENIHNLINEVGANLMMNNNIFNYTKFYSQYSMEIAFPMAMGFPFIYTLETPTVVNMGLQMRGSMQPLKYDPNLANTNFLKITGNYHLVYSTHVEGKLGFITPYNDKIYLAGLEKSVHVNIPLHSKLDLNLKDSKIDAFFQPLEKNNEQKVFEYSTGAFTTVKNVYDTSPAAVAKNTAVIQDKPLKFVHKNIGQEKTGFCFDIKLATDKNNIYEKLKDHDLLSLALFADTLDEINNQNFTIVYNPQSSWSKNMKLSLTYDKTGIINSKAASERMDVKYNKGENEEKENFGVPRFENKESFQQKLVENVAMGIKDAQTHFINFQLAFEGLHKTEYELYFAYADSYVSNVSSILAFAKNSTTSSLNPKEYMIALQMTSMMPNVSLMNYKNILNAMPSSKIKGRVDFGEQIPYKSHIIIQGELNTSQKRRRYLELHPLAILCEKQIQKGYKLQPACRNITRRSLYHDNYHFNIAYQNIPNGFKNMAQRFYRYLNTLWYEYNSEDAESKKIKGNIDVNIKFGKHLLSSNLSIVTSDFSDSFENVPIYEWIRPMIVTHPKYNMIQRLGHKILAAQESPLCTFDKDVITTFDNSSYFVNMGNTAHILAHNIPENYIFQTNDNSDEYFSIIAIQPSSESLELTIVVGDNVLEIKQNGNDLPIRFLYNGQQVTVSDYLVQLKDVHENVVLKLFVLSEGAVKIIAVKNGFEVLCHKNHVTIEVSNQFRSKLRGLCGNFDGESYNEFITPENCIMGDTEQFIASYDLGDSSKRLAMKEKNRKPLTLHATSKPICLV